MIRAILPRHRAAARAGRRLAALALSAVLALAAAPYARAQPGEHTLNLKDADIRVFIATVSEITGRNFIVDPRVEGKVNVVSTHAMTADEVYDVFESVLRVHGYAAVPAGSMVKILPEALAKQDGAPGGDGTPGPDTLVTRIIQLKYVSTAELIPILNQLVPQTGQVSAHAGSNSLVVTDRAGNLARVEAIIRRIDTASDAEVEVVTLDHANAAELARTLTVLAEDKQALAGGTAPAKVFADSRTNSILLSGDRAARVRMRSLIAHLDTPISTGESTQVVYLRYAKAADMVGVLEQTAAALTGATGAEKEAKLATIQAHPETNSLVVSAAPAVYRELAAVIRQLDVRPLQVLIEGIVVEVSDEFAKELGVQLQVPPNGLDDNTFIGGTNFNGPNNLGSIVGTAQNPLGLGAGLTLGYITGTTKIPGTDKEILNLGALIRALNSDGQSNILAEPKTVTLDHQEAQLKVGQEVPFLTGQYANLSGTGGSGATPVNPFQTVERKDVGLQLTVTPHINEGDSVRLDIQLESSSLAPNVSGASDLVTNKRVINTAVLVQDGAMLVLGGLNSEELRESVNKVPALGDIPVVGNLFRYRNSTRLKRKLMMFLKPTILRDAAIEASVSSEKYNYIRTQQLEARENPQHLTRPEQQPVLPPWQAPLRLPDAAAIERGRAPEDVPSEREAPRHDRAEAFEQAKRRERRD